MQLSLCILHCTTLQLDFSVNEQSKFETVNKMNLGVEGLRCFVYLKDFGHFYTSDFIAFILMV